MRYEYKHWICGYCGEHQKYVKTSECKACKKFGYLSIGPCATPEIIEKIKKVLNLNYDRDWLDNDYLPHVNNVALDILKALDYNMPLE